MTTKQTWKVWTRMFMFLIGIAVSIYAVCLQPKMFFEKGHHWKPEILFTVGILMIVSSTIHRWKAKPRFKDIDPDLATTN